MSLQGKTQLLKRFDAIKGLGKPIAKKWAASASRSAKRRVPVKTGRLQRSIRPKFVRRGAILVGHYSANFVDAGTKEHREKPKRRRGKSAALRYGGPGGQPIFARRVRHPSTRARPFKQAAARDGLRENPMAQTLVKLWNDAG